MRLHEGIGGAIILREYGTGEKVNFFMTRLDRALAFYPDVTRCSGSGHSYDRNGRISNSLTDHYRNRDIRHNIDKLNV